MIVESSGDAILSKSLTGVITTWNKGAERIFGYKAEEAVGKPITIVIPPDRLEKSPLSSPGFRPASVSTIFDISERKRAAAHQELMLREMHHPIKNLFAITGSIITLAALFRTRPDPPHGAARHARQPSARHDHRG